MLLISTEAYGGTLKESASRFNACAVGKADVDVAALSDATKSYCTLLRRFGPFTAGSIHQVLSCLQKLEEGREVLIGSTPKGSRAKLRKATRSMRALLAAEAESGIHKAGGVLADPSAAMGLLWVRRGLQFWARVFELEAKRLMASGCEWGEAGTLLRQTNMAYEDEISEFHGWVARKAFMISARSAPDWQVLCERAGLAAERKKLGEELRTWAKVLNGLARRMQALHMQYDLEDKRRTL